MSSQHQYLASAGSSGGRVGDIEHMAFLSENIGQLCLSSEYSDITLIVENQSIPAHKVILATRSEYFRALLFGGMREASQSEVKINGAPLQAFKTLLRYVYSGHMALTTLKEDHVLDILGLAHQFGFPRLEIAISEYLRQILAMKNVCSILDIARLYGLEGLKNVCHEYIDRHALEILQHSSFVNISLESLQEILERDSFFAPEVDVFKAICKWCEANPQATNNGDAVQMETILKCVRFPLMTLDELLTVVRPVSLVSPDMLLDAIHEKTHTNSACLKHRGCLLPDENIATEKYGASVIHGEMRSALLEFEYPKYDMEKGYTRHEILEDDDNAGIIVELGTPSIINHLKLLLWDRDLRSYSYFIEVSIDKKDWVRVIDYSNYFCRSWQHLYFEPRVVKYIKLVGTHNTVNKVFHAVSLKAMYVHTMPELINGIIKPTYNVATVVFSACVIEGVSRSRDSLLNGDTSNYDWDYGYTCHQIGSGGIVIQLGQPYIIDSMRMLLWDCDDRSYSYYVETSVNDYDYVVIADKIHNACRSWQVLKFPPTPVVFIQIVGVSNSANEVFHLVHFECPAQEDSTSSNGVGNAVTKSKPAPLPSSTTEASPPPVAFPPTETAQEAEEHDVDRN